MAKASSGNSCSDFIGFLEVISSLSVNLSSGKGSASRNNVKNPP
jgi:hypothetical protein